jgi:hypothetical protein
VRCIVFTGPTLAPADGATLLDATYRPPAAQGDVYHAALEKPWAIGIIDGYFERVPAVWHKEILWAMAQGVHVFGSASMGALRAAELHTLGMVGVGEIFEQFRRGELTDDDEVTIVHAPATLGHRPLSDAMVNIRATLARAQTLGVVGEATAHALVALAKAKFYPERSYARLLPAGRGAGLPAGELDALEAWLPEHRVDRKRLDARAMLERMAEARAAAPGPMRVRYQFQHTDAWEQVRRQIDQQPLHGGQGGESPQHDALLDELRLDPARHRATTREALVRALALDLAEAQGTEASPAMLTQVLEDFRRARGLETPQAMAAWLARQGLDVEAFTALLQDEARLRQLLPLYDGDLGRHVTDVLRLTDDHAALAQRAAHKQAQLARRGLGDPTLASAGTDEAGLWRWLFGTCFALALPDDVERWATSHGFRDADALRRVALREYVYRTLLAAERARDGADAGPRT